MSLREAQTEAEKRKTGLWACNRDTQSQYSSAQGARENISFLLFIYFFLTVLFITTNFWDKQRS